MTADDKVDAALAELLGTGRTQGSNAVPLPATAGQRGVTAALQPPSAGAGAPEDFGDLDAGDEVLGPFDDSFAYDPDELVGGYQAPPEDAIQRGVDLDAEVVGPAGNIGKRGQVFQPPSLRDQARAEFDSQFDQFKRMEAAKPQTAEEALLGFAPDEDPGAARLARVMGVSLDGETPITPKPGEPPAAGALSTGVGTPHEASELEASITLLRKHHTPEAVLESMSGEQILAWGRSLAPVYNDNLNVRRELAELRKGTTGNGQSQNGASGGELAGTPPEIDLVALRQSLESELDKETGGKLAATIESILSRNNALEQQLSTIVQTSEQQQVDNQVRRLASLYPQLGTSPVVVSNVVARARTLVKTGEYRGYDRLFDDAAKLVLGMPQPSQDPEQRASENRLRDRGQVRAQTRRQSDDAVLRGSPGMSEEELQFRAFQRLEAQKARSRAYLA